MKKLLSLLLILCFWSSAYAEEETYYIPMATGLNTETPQHLINNNETSFAKNIIFKRGNALKRFGVTKVNTFPGEILGYWQATDDYALIAAHNGDDPGGVQIWEWDMNVEAATIRNLNLNHITKTSTSFEDFGGGHGGVSGDRGQLFHPTAEWHFTNHYDDAVGYVTVMTNGEDAVHVYVHPDQANSSVWASWEERNIDFLYDPDMDSTDAWIKGYYPASFHRVLYMANVTLWSETDVVTQISATTAIKDKTAVVWSEINDASDFSVTQYFQQRPEGGTGITGITEFQDALVLTKEDQVWQIRPYSNFTRISSRNGASNHEGLVSFNTVYANDRGRITDLLTGQFLSYPIHTRFASQEAGIWDIKGRMNKYADELTYTVGKEMYTYKLQQGGWELYIFPFDVDILAYLEPGRPFEDWVGQLQYHDVLTIAEEDTISDYVLKYGPDGKDLVIMNHFSFDNATTGDTDGTPIEVIYETRQDACGSVKNFKRFFEINIQGLPNMGPISVYGNFKDSPQRTSSWELLGTITTDSLGEGQLDIDKNSKWIALRFIENSKNPFTLSDIYVKYEIETDR